MQANNFYFEVARGSRQGMTGVHAAGNNADVDAAEDIFAAGGTLQGVFAAAALEIISASANDASAGTGARTVTIEGLDANGVIKTETATTNGITAVALTGTWTAVNRAFVASAGSSATNEGIVTVRKVAGGVVCVTIPALEGLSNGAFYCVPAGYRLLVTSIQISVSTAGTVTGGLARVSPSGITTVSPVTVFVLGQSPYRVSLDIPIVFGPGEVAKLRVTAVSAVDQSVAGALFGVLLSPAAV